MIYRIYRIYMINMKSKYWDLFFRITNYNLPVTIFWAAGSIPSCFSLGHSPSRFSLYLFKTSRQSAKDIIRMVCRLPIADCPLVLKRIPLQSGPLKVQLNKI